MFYSVVLDYWMAMKALKLKRAPPPPPRLQPWERLWNDQNYMKQDWTKKEENREINSRICECLYVAERYSYNYLTNGIEKVVLKHSKRMSKGLSQKYLGDLKVKYFLYLCRKFELNSFIKDFFILIVTPAISVNLKKQQSNWTMKLVLARAQLGLGINGLSHEETNFFCTHLDCN